MSAQQVGTITAGCFVIVACVGVIATSRRLAGAFHEASWGRFGVAFRPRLARMGTTGAGAIGTGLVVLALMVAAP